jgi:hypothetical protein
MWNKVGVALAAAVLAVPVQATVTVQSRSISFAGMRPNGFNYDIPFKSFATFDLGAEQLNKVTLNVTAWLDGRITATNNTRPTQDRPDTRRDVTATVTLDVSVSRPELNAAASTSYTGGRIFPGNGSSAPLFVSPSLVAEMSITSNFDQFLIVGNSMYFNYNVGTTTAYPDNPDFAYLPIDITDGELVATLTYESAVSPVAGVPEPATWAGMMFGFGAIGFSMRRRTLQRASSPAAPPSSPPAPRLSPAN